MYIKMCHSLNIPCESSLSPTYAGLCSVSSMRVLSFKNGRALLLLNNVIIAHLDFLGGELEAEELKDCFLLDLSPQTLERVVDATFCRGVLFLLDKSGWICILFSGKMVACKLIDQSLLSSLVQ